jgi:hypothetical protein
VRSRLDKAAALRRSSFTVAEILKSAAIEARRAATALDELPFRFEC